MNPAEPCDREKTREIVANGDNATLDYWHEPEETANTFRNGGLYTGDLAQLTTTASFCECGSGAGFVEMLGLACQLPAGGELAYGVRMPLEVAVLAMEDEVLGEAVKPYLVARMPGILRSRITCCKRHLLPKLVPKEFVLVPARPKNSAEKVLKRTVKSGEVAGRACL
jgi:long-chain acyl-CoA synthetase